MADPKTIAATQVIRLPMRAAEIASVRVLDTDLIVILKSGQRVTIRDGALRAMIDTNLRIAFADAEIRAADLLKQVGTVQADALSDLSVASKDAADADASKTPDANAPGKPLDVLSSNADIKKDMADFRAELKTEMQSQMSSLARQVETISGNIEGKLAQITQPEAASQAPVAPKSGFLANINPVWGALGALGALGGAGGGGGGAAADALISLVLTGTITLGPMLATNQLRVVAYDRDGRTLGSDETVDGATGAFEIKITNGHTGLVTLKVLDGDPNAPDYMDEATKTGLSLGRPGGLPDLRAIVLTEGIVPKTVHINPLTELVAVKAGMDAGAVVANKSSTEIIAISKALATTLELSTTGQLVSDIAVIPTINLDGTANASANMAGQLLDTISQLEKSNNFTSPTNAITAMASQIKDVVDGVAGFVNPAVTSVAQFLVALMQTPPSISGVAFSADTGVSDTDLITSTGTQNITITFSKPLEDTRTLSWKTTDATVWNTGVAGNGTSTLVLSGVSLPEGSKTLQFRYTSASTTQGETAQVNAGVNLAYTLDAQAPTTPVVSGLVLSADTGISSADLITNTAAQTVTGTITTVVASTERIFGSVDDGVTWSEITNRSTDSSAGKTSFTWNVAALVNETASGTKSLVFQLRDAAGNVSGSSASVPYVLDTAAPTAPTLALGTGVSDGASAAEATASDGVVTVTAEAGVSAVVTFSRSGGGTVSKTVTGTGSAQAVTLTSADLKILGDGSISVGATQTDKAGNVQTEAAANVTFNLSLSAPLAPTLALGAGVSNGATSAEATATGGVVTVKAQTGASAVVTFSRSGGGTVSKTVTGTGSAQAVTLTSADLTSLGDGSISVSATQTDKAGNAQTAPPASITFTLDRSAPTAPTLALGTDVSNGATSAEATDTGVVTITAENGASAVVTFTRGANTVTKTVAGTGSAQAVTLTSTDLTTLGDGSISVSATQTDAAGNAQTAAAATTTFFLDTKTPDNSIDLSTLTISSDTGTPGDFNTATKTQTIGATLGKALIASPAANLETLWGSVDNGDNWADLNGSIANRTTGGRVLEWKDVDLIEGNNTIVFKITDVAGNTLASLGNRTYFLETAPPPPILTLQADTGPNGTTNADGITSNGRFNVTDVQTGSTWQYSLNQGDTWKSGSNDFFIAPAGSYASGAIQLRQTNSGGLLSGVAKTSKAITIDTSADAPTLALAADTGTSGDFITNNGTMNVTGLETGATWRYQIGSGAWQTGGAVVTGSSSFVLPSETSPSGTTYAANTIVVEQTDLAGNTSASASFGNAVTVRTSPPVQSLSGLDISADSGTTATGLYSANESPLNNDWLTNKTSQTINATLGSALASGEVLRGSVDNGDNFTPLNLSLSGTSLNWTGVTLLANSRIILKVTDIAGNETEIANQAYKVDTTASAIAPASGSAISLSNQGIGTGGRFYTTSDQQRIQIELTGSLVTVGDDTETLWARTNTGTSWVNITSYLNNTIYLDWNMLLSGTTLTAGANQLQLKVTDKAGNFKTIADVAYTLVTTSYLTGLTGSAVAALGSDVALLTAAQVAQLSQTQLDGLTATQIGQLASASPSRLTGLSAAQIGFLGTDITGLSAAQVAALSTTQIGGLTSAQAAAMAAAGDLASLTNAQILALQPDAIDSVPTGVIVNLSAAQVATLSTAQVAALTLAQVQILSTAQLTALNNAGLLDDITQPLSTTQVGATGLNLIPAVNTTDRLALFNSALQAASGTAPLNLNNIASGAAAVVDAVNGGALTVANLTNLGLTGVTSTNLQAILTRIDATSTGTDASLVNSMSELRAMVVNASGELADGVNAQEAADGVTVAVALDGASVGQTITLTLPGSGGGTAQSITQNVTSTDLANGFALINISQQQLIDSGPGNKAVTASIGGGLAFAVDTFFYDLVAPTATVGSATYFANAQEGSTNLTGAAGFTSRTIVLTGTDFSTLLDTGETATTNIQARLDWSKLSYDFDGNDTGVDGSTYLGADGKLYGARGAFTVNDIESAFVTNDTTLTIKLTSAKARALESYNDFTKGDYFGADSNANNTYWTSGTGAGKGNQADTIDVLSGFLRDTASNTSTNSTADAAITYAGPAQTISLGAGNGNLRAPTVVAVNTGTLAAPVWVNKTFYHWDRSGDGTTSGDFVTHDTLDGLFYRNSNFTGGTAGADTTSGGFNTTDFRYGDLTTFNNIQLALPTAAASGDDFGYLLSANDANNQRSDLRAVWDQFNTVSGSGTGTPTGWGGNIYWWSATSTGAGAHGGIGTDNGFVFNVGDNHNIVSAALQLSNPTPTVSGVTYYGNYANEALFAAGALTRTMVINGTNFNQLLDMVNSGDTMGANGTDIKARLDWSKFTYDFDGNSTNGVQTAAAGTFTLADIESARVTSSNTLAIKFTNAKITALEAYSGDSSGAGGGVLDANSQTQRDYFGADSNANNSYWLTNIGAGRGLGNQADGVDIVNGFFKDVAGNVVASTSSTNDNLAITYAAPAQSITVGGVGNDKLIAPNVVAVNTGTLTAPVWVNKTFYIWDRNGDGASNDAVIRPDLTARFYRDSNFTGGTAGVGTTSAGFNATDFRYGDLTTFNQWKLALPTGAAAGDSATGTLVANHQGNQRSDLRALWDQFNTSSTTGGQTPTTVAGNPTGWTYFSWSATQSTDTSGLSLFLEQFTGVMNAGSGFTNYAALQVL
jgi:hypothetical protein